MCKGVLIKCGNASKLPTLQKHGWKLDYFSRVFVSQMWTADRNKSLLSGLHVGDETTQHGPEMRMIATEYNQIQPNTLVTAQLVQTREAAQLLERKLGPQCNECTNRALLMKRRVVVHAAVCVGVKRWQTIEQILHGCGERPVFHARIFCK